VLVLYVHTSASAKHFLFFLFRKYFFWRFCNNIEDEQKKIYMQEVLFKIPAIPTADKLPDFSEPGVTRDDCTTKVLGKLRRLSTWTSAVAHVINKDPSIVTDALRQNMKEAFWKSWIKYWAWQSSYLNEYK
jgi:hypothetical protein